MIKKICKKYEEEKEKNFFLKEISIINNFSLFLWSKGEI